MKIDKILVFGLAIALITLGWMYNHKPNQCGVDIERAYQSGGIR